MLITENLYLQLVEAYKFFNKELFNDALPDCLISIRAGRKAYGYFSKGRFSESETNIEKNANVIPINEIALNPKYFVNRSDNEVLSTLVHEMVHLNQACFGRKYPKTVYHNKEWARMMEDVGLMPSDTGEPGGKKTGVRVSHYIMPGNKFDLSCQAFLRNGFKLTIFEQPETRPAKQALRSKYYCPNCDQKFTAKPELNLLCADCNVILEVE